MAGSFKENVRPSAKVTFSCGSKSVNKSATNPLKPLKTLNVQTIANDAMATPQADMPEMMLMA
jgi:hypothetical protein